MTITKPKHSGLSSHSSLENTRHPTVGKHVPPDGIRWNRMQDAENRLIAEPARIGTDRLGGQRCKYAEKSYEYKYDLGHSFLYYVVVVE